MEYRISWVDENNQSHHLTGAKTAVESVKEAVEFFCGNKNVKVEELKPKKAVSK